MKRTIPKRNSIATAAGLFAALCVVSSAQAQPPSDGAGSRPDQLGSGAFAAIKEEVEGLSAHLIYRPRELDALGDQKLGVVAWGNGGCSDDGASSRFHLLELASHGYLVIANGGIYSGPGARVRAEAAQAQGQNGPAASRTRAAQLTEAIDWALAENQRPESPYFGRIDEAQVALSGFSCGGVQALRQAADPRVRTLVLHNTGLFSDSASQSAEMNLGKEALAAIHTPTIYILGGESDIAYANGMDDFKRIEHVPVAVANIDKGHGGTFAEEHGGSAARVAAQWLNWQLRGDSEAARMFTDADCGLCVDAEWSYERKNFDQAAE